MINTFPDKPATLSLGTGELAPAVEQRLIGLAEGANQTFELAAGEAFGERNLEMLQWCVQAGLAAKSATPTPATPSATWSSSRRPTGRARYAGVGARGRHDWLLFDFNHPLAGQPVSFEVQVIGVL